MTQGLNHSYIEILRDHLICIYSTNTDEKRVNTKLVTVGTLIANGNTEQLVGHLKRAKENRLTETELASCDDEQ